MFCYVDLKIYQSFGRSNQIYKGLLVEKMTHRVFLAPNSRDDRDLVGDSTGNTHEMSCQVEQTRQPTTKNICCFLIDITLENWESTDVGKNDVRRVRFIPHIALDFTSSSTIPPKPSGPLKSLAATRRDHRPFRKTELFYTV